MANLNMSHFFSMYKFDLEEIVINLKRIKWVWRHSTDKGVVDSSRSHGPAMTTLLVRAAPVICTLRNTFFEILLWQVGLSLVWD